MNSTVWESEAAELLTDAREGETPASVSANVVEPMGAKRIDGLKQLTLQLFREVQSISDVERLSVETGVDYYQEVRRFEIDLIRRALLQTAGHQRRAARLLNLKVTTLNSKMKLLNIRVDDAIRYPLAGRVEPASRPHV